MGRGSAVMLCKTLVFPEPLRPKTTISGIFVLNPESQQNKKRRTQTTNIFSLIVDTVHVKLVDFKKNIFARQKSKKYVIA